MFEDNAVLSSVQPQEGDTELVVLSPNLFSHFMRSKETFCNYIEM